MEIIGKIIHKLDPVSGTSKSGNAWSKQEYVLETNENYPKKVFFNLWGDRASQYPMEVGQMVKVSFDLESREFNGRWYTDVRAWKAEQVDPNTVAAAQAPATSYAGAPAPAPAMPAAPAAPAPDFSAPAEGDDLPF